MWGADYAASGAGGTTAAGGTKMVFPVLGGTGVYKSAKYVARVWGF
jgi:hypothetical protein